ncbi:inactive pancreatic lipase-related protein 1-like [Lytechinus variegatus]|uniref:inactive pancreatic lipase-related protein 1-like n=1 Tax=Lytechinus variegatus TaxID=7654 RepID=UPI001BB2261F|nr:inactive pancreatic lipase-related protein 1-like [Lytechinus variegatus]
MNSFRYTLGFLTVFLCTKIAWCQDATTPTQDTTTPTCYDGVGSYTFSVSFGTCHQRSPRSTADICSSFTLISNETREKGGVDVSNLSNPPFDSSRDTKILIPGFTNEFLDEKWDQLKEAFLDEGNNVIMVNWSQAANLTNYAQARADARVVGFQVAHVISYIVNNTSATYDQMHLIGGGMGAHVAGYAGSTGQQMARITGLDPAGSEGNPETFGLSGGPSRGQQCRLDITDAEYVDIIHTNAHSGLDGGYIGLPFQLGHQDFFVNNGINQPGCNEHGEDEEVCNHGRALDYFIESVPLANYGSFPCEEKAHTLEELQDGAGVACNPENPCPEMGYRAEKIKGDGFAYLVETNAESPYTMPYPIIQHWTSTTDVSGSIE